MGKKRVSRRVFLRNAALAASGAALVACQPQTVVIKETVEVEKQVTQVVEKEVTKVVKETVIVEKEVVPQEEMSDVQELRVCGAMFAGNGDMAELDPPRRGTWGFHSQLWAMLVFGDTAGNAIPEKSLAEGWDVSDDGTVYTFYLRRQAKFSDGTPITAEHVVGSFGYMAMMNHKEASGFRDNFGTGRRLYWDIVGMMDVPLEAEYDPFGTLELPGVQAVDDFTVQITLEKPAIGFIPRLTVAGGVFNPADLEAARDIEYDLLDWWTAHATYSGPYKLVEAVPGDRYAMVPNEHYFGPKPKIEKITMFQVSPDSNTRLTAFANKEIDMLAYSIGGDDARQAYADP